MSSLDSLADPAHSPHVPDHVHALHQCREHLIRIGFQAPQWREVLDGARPAAPDPLDTVPGEWRHGWQHAASGASEKSALHNMTARLRREAPHEAVRNDSCGGPLASAWLLAAPRTGATTLGSSQMRLASRRRAGVDLGLEPGHCSGCGILLDVWSITSAFVCAQAVPT